MGSFRPSGSSRVGWSTRPARPCPRCASSRWNRKTRTDADGTTDEDGRWKLAVPPAEYTVNFDLDGRTQWVKGTRDQEAATLFTIAAGQSITVDETLLPTGTIAGKLVNTKGKAVRDADVTLHQDGDSVGYAQTDENGQYRFERVFTGTYKVLFEPSKAPGQWAYGKASEATATPITVTADQVTTVNEKLLVLGAVAGRFTTGKGKGIAKAIVKVAPAKDDDDAGQDFTAKTDSTGRFKVAGVLPSQYKVSFTDRTGRTQYAYGKGARAAAKVFTVTSGKTTTVNDKQVAPATLRITAVDCQDGQEAQQLLRPGVSAPRRRALHQEVGSGRQQSPRRHRHGGDQSTVEQPLPELAGVASQDQGG